MFLKNTAAFGTPQNNPWIIFCMNTTTGVSYSTTSYFSLAPYSLSATMIPSGDIQVFPCFASMPLITPVNWAIYGLIAETSQGTTAHTAVLGAAQDYLMIGSGAMGAALPNNTLYSLLMKFQ